MSLSRLLCLSLFIAALGGCGFYGDKQRAWTEDVALDDGTRLQIERHVKFTDHNSLAQDSYGAVETEATLHFLDDYSTLPVWSAPLIPLVLYRSPATHEWVIVATTSMCEVWRKRGRPIPAYWEYRTSGDQWWATVFSAESIGRKANLFFNYHEGLPAQHLTMEQKRRDWADGAIAKKYLQVLSAPEMSTYCKT